MKKAQVSFGRFLKQLSSCTTFLNESGTSTEHLSKVLQKMLSAVFPDRFSVLLKAYLSKLMKIDLGFMFAVLVRTFLMIIKSVTKKKDIMKGVRHRGLKPEFNRLSHD